MIEGPAWAFVTIAVLLALIGWGMGFLQGYTERTRRRD